MNPKLLTVCLASALAALGTQAFAQTSGKNDSTYSAGGSARCESMTGAEKQQCLNDEGAKTEKGIGTPSASDSASDTPAKSPSEAATDTRSTSSSGASTGSDTSKIDPDTPANAYDKPKQ